MRPNRRNAVDNGSSLPIHQKKIRLVVLGAPGVGKTQLVSHFLGRSFHEFYIPTIEDFHRLKYIIDGHAFQLDVLDQSGQTLNPAMQNLTLLTGDIFLVVYSIGHRETWDGARDIITMIEEVTSDAVTTCRCMARNFKATLLSNGGTVQRTQFENGILERSESSPTTSVSPNSIFLIGNKCDLQDVEVQSHEVEAWLHEREHVATSRVEHIVLSAKTDFMVQEFFDSMFTESVLPVELSPKRHRRVAEQDFSTAISLIGNYANHLHKKDRIKILQAIANIPSISSKATHEQASPTAIAVHCQYERRPSIDTEVLLAISKVRNVGCEVEKTPHVRVSLTRNGSKIKKQLSKMTDLALH